MSTTSSPDHYYNSGPATYEAAGVSISRGDAFARHIAALKSTAIGSIGGFAGVTPLDVSGMQQPQLMSTTDGVGTKILVAKALNQYGTIGIDLVAMCVNDLAVCGADPLQFLDYIACGRINHSVLASVLDGIVSGCEQAGCILAGGETAEMPDAYQPDDLDLAGFAVGVVDARDRLPRLHQIQAGDIILGAPSSGIHSNGFSLARHALAHDHSAWGQLLEPTMVYVPLMKRIRGSILSAAHITGGGLIDNIARVLPDTLAPRLSWDWRTPEIFERIASAGSVAQEEMRAVFNMGVGMAVIVRPHHVDHVLRAAAGGSDRTWRLFAIGEVVARG